MPHDKTWLSHYWNGAFRFRTFIRTGTFAVKYKSLQARFSVNFRCLVANCKCKKSHDVMVSITTNCNA